MTNNIDPSTILIPPARLMPLRMIWGGLTASNFIYIFLCWNQIQQRDPGEFVDMMNYPMTPVFAGGAVVLLIICFFLTGRMISYAQETANRNPPADRVSHMVSSFMTPWIVRMAIFETVTLLGFLISFSTLDLRAVLIFGAVGIALQLAHFPTKRRIYSWNGFQV